MNFGQHIERAITNFGLSLENMQQRHHDWNEESKALGLIEDSEKLQMLKRDLYSEVRLNSPNQQKILNLTQAIQTLEEIKHAKETREFERCKHSYTLPVQLHVFSNTVILTAIALVIVSYLGSYTCGNSRSQFCSNTRIIPTQVELFFRN